jgi:hypothetical protein
VKDYTVYRSGGCPINKMRKLGNIPIIVYPLFFDGSWIESGDLSRWLYLVIDYTDGQMVDLSARRMAVLKDCSVSCSETEVRNGIKSWKARLFSSGQWQKPIRAFYFGRK